MFYDPFCGGCNVSVALTNIGVPCFSSDLYVRCFPFVEKIDYRDIDFRSEDIAWLSPPCVDFSAANHRANFNDRVVFENPTLSNLKTIFIENVKGFRVLFPELLDFAKRNGYFISAGIVDLSQYGSIQKRQRFICCVTRDRSHLIRFNNFFSKPKTDYERLSVFWYTASFLGVEEGRDKSLTSGFYRKHTGRGVRRHYLSTKFFPTFTRSNLSRVYAFKTRDFGFPSDEMWRLDGFPLTTLEPLLDNRSISQSVVGDGVPYLFVLRLLTHIFGNARA